MQGLGRTAGAGHQYAQFGEGAFGLDALLVDRLLHVLQIGATMAGFVARDQVVDVLDHRLGVPFAGPAIPLGQPQFATEMQHQGLERRCRVEFEADFVQFFFGRQQVRAEAAQIFHQHQRMLLFLVEPDRHEGREIGVVTVVAQEHLGGRQRRPFGHRVHLDGQGLFVAELVGFEGVPGNVLSHVPAGRLEGAKEFGVKHVLEYPESLRSAPPHAERGRSYVSHQLL